MKRFLFIGFLFMKLCSFAQENAGIYKVRWFIDNRLTNQFVFNNNSGRLSIPTRLYDSTVNEIKNIVQQELMVPSQYVYSMNSKGVERKTAATSEQVGGFPTGTKRQAMKTEYMEYYVKFKITVGLTKGVGVGGPNANYSRLHPFVKVKMKAYGIDKRCKYRKVTRARGFRSIGSFQTNVGGTTVSANNALPIEQVMDMVFQGLTKFKNKVK